MPSFSQLFQSQNSEITSQLRERLREVGFEDVQKTRRKHTKLQSAATRAEKLLRSLASEESDKKVLFSFIDNLISDLSRSADAVLSLINLSRLCDAAGNRGDFLSLLSSDAKLRARLCRLLSFSQIIADTLIQNPHLIKIIQQDSAPSSRAELRQRLAEFIGRNSDKIAAIRQFRQREILRIALFDMERATWQNAADFEIVVRWISDLAIACVQQAWQLMSASKKYPFAIIAMGKLGARELNYSSDIDLIFLHDAPPEQLAELENLAQQLLKVLLGQADGSSSNAIWRVDMRLRPEGKSGQLLTNLRYAFGYYESYAAAWELQAQIKSRAVAGDAAIARRFRRFIRGIVWAKRRNDDHLREIMTLKRRSEAENGEISRNIKTGIGGIRDAEWIVQQLQLMVGPEHSAVRLPSTLQGITQLRAIDALTEHEMRMLCDGYLFLRTVEHRLQIFEERAVREIPTKPAQLAALARRMGSRLRGASAARWIEEEINRVRQEIRALNKRLFWGWNDVNGTDSANPTLQDLKKVLFDAPVRIKRICEGTPNEPFPKPLSRQIQSAFFPLLSQLEHSADPARALINLERLCDASGNRLSLLRSLGENASLRHAVITILGGSDALSNTLIRFPELLDLAARHTQFSQAITQDSARADCRAYCLIFRDHHAALRRWIAREMLRVGLRDLVLEISPLEICAEISHLAGAALEFATEEVRQKLRPQSDLFAFAVIAMGKLGGSEMHYSSDADVIFVHDAYTESAQIPQTAENWASEIIQYLSEITPAGSVINVDSRLRPEGMRGDLTPSLHAYFRYFDHDISIWERQALTRARIVAGERETAAKLLAAIRSVAFPQRWQAEWSDELRHMKMRVETERGSLDKSTFDVKLGSGALSDIEWAAQWLALKYGAKIPTLQTANTWEQIGAAATAKVLLLRDAQALKEAYLFLRRAELRRQIIHCRSESAVSRGQRDFIMWARAIYPEQSEAAACETFEKQWRLHTTAVRNIFVKIRDSL